MPGQPVNIGEVVVHALVFDPKNAEALRTMDMNEIVRSVPQLFDLLDERGIEYVLVGGIAMLVYVEGRNTQDIDLIVPPDALDQLPEIVVEDRQREIARTHLNDLRVDFLFTSNKLFAKICREHVAVQRFAERDVPCATVEGLLLLKLFALPSLYRQYRLDRVRLYENDVAELVSRFHPPLEPVYTELAKHVLDTDLVETRSKTRFGNGDGPPANGGAVGR
jgi:hypothetical protein